MMSQPQRAVHPATTPVDWRRDFPALGDTMNGQPLVFLDSAASAQKPRAVIDATSNASAHGYANVHRGLYQYSSELTARFEAVRAKVARFIGARSPDTIIFTGNTTAGINLVAQSWGRAHTQAGDTIVITAMEHHANIVPWQLLAGERGLTLSVWPITPQGTLDLSELPALITPQTKMLALTHISNVLGTINDIKAIIAAARAINPAIRILVDGSQAVVHAPVDVIDLDADFYVFTAHKLYGPTGLGVLYGRYDVLQSMPPFIGGGDMIDRVAFSGTTYRDAPYRFEAGTPPILEVIALGAAIDYVTAIDWPAIMAHEAALAGHLAATLAGIPGIKVFGPGYQTTRAGLFSFAADWGHASDIAMILDQQGVAVRSGHHCAMPLHDILGVPATVRASLALYNNLADIDALGAALRKARAMLS
jgi:cysteine desulfurase/selenocysteine lyase